MKCPIDNADLLMTSREGIEIDYCPQCRGVWLDRGELDKIIERSAGPSPSAPPPQHPEPPRQDYRPDHRYKDRDDDDRYRKKKRSSFLGDIFDF
ncbi:hypothetical protein GCM10011321_07840 [Youhaiella tibetensis]|uniref:Uncharacterized protein n=1 Tax=Paradevosia tibetensis TaxID=1447062 RepID=A0A5B9DPG4_9HYPH|nr:zf-TFIIB domain-containing protein [Youhaiella tibetensis]QEE21043.1 hypothetical protein FNA67_13030 [Youhaiella tibetensis]GGF18578.1 hypothetical protein GCM10011321_07840 [Youhaiella tibetensis]